MREILLRLAIQCNRYENVLLGHFDHLVYDLQGFLLHRRVAMTLHIVIRKHATQLLASDMRSEESLRFGQSATQIMRTITRPVRYTSLSSSVSTLRSFHHTIHRTIILATHRIHATSNLSVSLSLHNVVAVLSAIAIHVPLAVIPANTHSFVRNPLPVLHILHDSFLAVALRAPHPIRTANYTIARAERRKKN